MKHVTRLNLDNTFNTRDLGGIPLGPGRYVKWNKAFRSDDVSKISAADAHRLRDHGVDAIIDLRREEERAATGYVLADNAEFEKHYLPLTITDRPSDAMKADVELSLSEFYLQLLDDGKDDFKEIFSVLADPREGGILFHCAGGKDRTGVVAALLLGLLGANDGDILANYEVTFSHLLTNPDFVARNHPRERVNSDRDNLVPFLEQLRADYGDARGFLLECGLTEAQLEQIQETFTEAE